MDEALRCRGGSGAVDAVTGIDDWVDESNPVRVIDAFVDALDIGELGFDGVEPAATGRPSYHPSCLLKLYIYGYLNRGAVEPAARTRSGAQPRGDGVARSIGARPQDDCRLPQGQRRRHQEGLCTVRRTVPADGPAFEGERCDRWQQVQSREQPRQEFHEREDRATTQAIGRKRIAVSEPARHGRSTGSVGDADVEEGADQGETGEAAIGDG